MFNFKIVWNIDTSTGPIKLILNIYLGTNCETKVAIINGDISADSGKCNMDGTSFL